MHSQIEVENKAERILKRIGQGHPARLDTTRGGRPVLKQTNNYTGGVLAFEWLMKQGYCSGPGRIADTITEAGLKWLQGRAAQAKAVEA